MRFVTDRDVAALVSVEEAAGAIEGAFDSLARGHAAMQTRVRTSTVIGKLSTLGALLDDERVAGTKVYSTAPDGRFCFVIILFEPGEGRWLATLEGGELTRIRTAATSLVAASILARPESSVLAIFGAGVQARAHALALAGRFPLTQIRVVHRRPVPEFVEALRASLGMEVIQSAEADEAVTGSDLVVTATRAGSPLFDGDSLSPGAHVTSVGATSADTRELDARTIERARVIVVDSGEQARLEAGNLIGAGVGWDEVDELADLVSGRAKARRSDRDITVFDSLGTGLADVAVAMVCYQRAVELGRGAELEGKEWAV